MTVPGHDILTSIAVSIVAAAGVALLARRARQPLILGYVLGGALLGPHIGVGLVTDEASIELIAEMGLILLLFIIGLEISVPALAQAGRTIAVWGLAFKAKTDDVRESPALVLIDDLLEAGAIVHAHDPEAMPNVRAMYGDKVKLFDTMYGAVENADGLALVTEWREFRLPDFPRMKRIMKEAAIFDGRNIWRPKEMKALGFTYTGIGRQV